MGKRGPAPTPTKILEARGSWRAKVNPAEPRPVPGPPEPPAWLRPAARVVWDQVVEVLKPTGVLTKADGQMLARYCDALCLFQINAKWLEDKGEVYPVRDKETGEVKDLIKWPQVSSYHQLAAVLTQYEREFGMSPSSRTRIQVPTVGDQPEQNKSRFFPSGPALKLA